MRKLRDIEINWKVDDEYINIACMVMAMPLDLIWGLLPSLKYGTDLLAPANVASIAGLFYAVGAIPLMLLNAWPRR